ncbi:MAG: sugar-binding domain-containing protein [Sedimentisphaerales bacterium]
MEREMNRCDFFKIVGLAMVLMLCSSIWVDANLARRPLMTRWASQVGADKVHRAYPRPQMVRKSWMNLNGLWEYAVVDKDEQQPKTYDGHILVPFPVESTLSGVMQAVGEDKRLWYKRTFEVLAKGEYERILLHFGAVDWEATVWVNGNQVGTHRGGYDPFTFDITDALKREGTQEIVLSVWDPADAGYQPRGKQVKEPKGIWYTSVTGIWQTVWLEPVSSGYIESLRIVPDIDAGVVRVAAFCSDAAAGFSIETEAKDEWFTKGKAAGNVEEEIIIPIKKPKLWSPDSPFLYDLKVVLKDSGGRKVDAVSSYFGMRKITLGKDEAGITRIFLNNKPLFMFGLLDQGWWPDGLYTAPSDEALRYDIEVTRKLGFNVARKHVKVEPARWYYWCDKIGLLVWQDMPSGDRYIGKKDPDIQRSDESARQFELESKRIIDTLVNHPSIVMWVPFNEGWGQYKTEYIVEFIRQCDPTRLVNNASGWADRGVGDVHDIHSYPGPASPPSELDRASVLGEFGGLGLPVKGHTWQDEKNWGYRSFETRQELTEAYLSLLDKLQPLIEKGLSSAIYTQTTDVEIEVNGMMTYDRAIIKMDPRRIATANRRVILGRR